MDHRGLAAVDFLMPNYYVWAKIIEALADLGYDPNMLVRSVCSSSRKSFASSMLCWASECCAVCGSVLA